MALRSKTKGVDNTNGTMTTLPRRARSKDKVKTTLEKHPEALTLLMYSRGVRLKAGKSSVRVSPMPAVVQL